ncbi:hypothetical protein pb186bvf_009987 [Paramecium bursaria]
MLKSIQYLVINQDIMNFFNIGVLPYDSNTAQNTLKQLAHRNAIKKDNITILFKYRRANKKIESERDRIKDQIRSYSKLNINIMMILIKFDRIPIMKDQIKSLLLPLVKVKDQVIIMIDQFHISEDKELDYGDIQSLIDYFQLKVFIVYLDKEQVINDIFKALSNFNKNQILQLSENQNDDLITIQNITKQLNDLHKKIIMKNQMKSKNKKANKRNKKLNKAKQDMQFGDSQIYFQVITSQENQRMITEITDIPYKGLNQNIQQNQTTQLYDSIYEQNYPPQLIQDNENNQQSKQYNILIEDNLKEKKTGWCCLI